MNKIFDYLRLFFVAGVVIALDQWTKMLVRVNIPFGEAWAAPESLNWLTPYARIIHWQNSGAAFGSFQGFSWIFTILAFVVAGMIIYYYPRVDSADWWLKLAMGMQMGGALGNVVDRITNDGHVTDFISVGNFPVFNIADSSISVGVAILLLGMWFKERAERKARQAEETPQIEQHQGEGQGTGG